MKRITLALLAIIVTGCATNPATGQRQIILMSEAEEIQLGRTSDAEIRKQMGVYNDADLQRYVEGVGMKLARAAHRPNLPWTFTVVNESAVNAFALPGGFVYITRGILPFLRDESELAAVLGHEVGHVDARHSADAYSKQMLAGGGLAVAGILGPETRTFQALLGGLGVGAQLAFLKNGRGAELQADQLGVGYTATSGWDPRGMPGLLATLGRLDEATGSSRGVPNWALSHPPADDRVVKVQEAVAAAQTSNARATNKPELDRHLDGLVFGDSREKGIVRGSELLHPILRFAVQFPDRWEVANGDEQVVARASEGSNAVMLLQVAPNATGSVEQTARTGMTAAGFTETSGDRASIHGLNAYVGTYSAVINNTQYTARAAHVQSGSTTYVMAGLAPAASFSSAEAQFRRAIESFRPLSQQEADRIQPNRVDFYAARNGDTWESIARDRCAGLIKATSLAIMNGREISSPPTPGDRLRIVVGG